MNTQAILQRLRINSTGNIAVSSGNITPSTAAKGINLTCQHPGEQEDLLAFGTFVESVRQWGHLERAKLGL